MSKKLQIELAGVRFEITTCLDQSLFFSDFLSDSDASDEKITVCVDEIKAECRQSRTNDVFAAERLIIHRKAADMLTAYNACVCHGAAISYGRKGYLFCGRSGAGKTTHSSLWEKYLGDRVTVINGDKPIIRNENGAITLYSSPWAGKEDRKTNTFAPLCGICFIKKGKANTVTEMSGNCAGRVLGQIYLPQEKEALDRTLETVDVLLETVPVYELDCDISEAAFRASFAVLTKEEYK